MADLSNVWVLVDINEKDLAKVRKGQAAIVIVGAFPDLKLKGRITYIADLVNESTRTVKARRSRLIFQEGHLSGLLGFESQGFLNAWGPVFFFAMIFAISMDYTVFLLASAKEHWDRSHDAHEATVAGLAHSGRTIFAAGAVMIAVFFTFALSGPLPPKEMGVILGTAVLLDAFLVRLVLMPVLLRLLGPAAWASPRWLARILPDVRFGH